MLLKFEKKRKEIHYNFGLHADKIPPANYTSRKKLSKDSEIDGRIC